DVNIPFHAYCERYIAGIQAERGASIRDSLKIINKVGICSSKLYLNHSKEPDEYIFKHLDNKYNISYKRINQTLDNILSLLYTNHPIIFGYSVYDTDELPQKNNILIGSDCGIICGYNLPEKYFIIKKQSSK